MSIFLLRGVGWLAVELLERKAKALGVVVLTFGQFEVGDESLQLVKHVVVKHLTLVLLVVFLHAVIHAQDVVAECRRHEELLHH